MKVVVDPARCQGVGICESLDPDRFEVGDDGELTILRAEVSDVDRTAVVEAVASCPTEALRIED